MKRFFWRYDDGMYEFTGLYLWRGWFVGFGHVSGRDGHAILDDIFQAADP